MVELAPEMEKIGNMEVTFVPTDTGTVKIALKNFAIKISRKGQRELKQNRNETEELKHFKR